MVSSEITLKISSFFGEELDSKTISRSGLNFVIRKDPDVGEVGIYFPSMSMNSFFMGEASGIVRAAKNAESG